MFFCTFLFVFLIFRYGSNSYFAPEFEHTRLKAPTTQRDMTHTTRSRPTNETASGFLDCDSQRGSFINGLHSLLSYLFGWLGHWIQLSPPSARNRCASLDVSLSIQTGRGAPCALAFTWHIIITIPWGVQFDTGSRAKASELCGVVTERWCTERGRQRNS